MGIFRKIISSIAIFLCLTSFFNILLSIFVYYLLPNLLELFLLIRWPLSFCGVSFLVMKRKIIINDINHCHH